MRSFSIILFPFSDKLVRLAKITIRDGKKTEVIEDRISIDERFLERPAFAMELCRSKAREMAELIRKSLGLALQVLLDYDRKKADEVIKMESVADS